MQNIKWTKCGAAVAAAVLLSPVLLIFCVPLAIGSGINVFVFGEAPLVLALCVPTLLVLLRGLSAPAGADQRPASQEAELTLGHVPELR